MLADYDLEHILEHLHRGHRVVVLCAPRFYTAHLVAMALERTEKFKLTKTEPPFRLELGKGSVDFVSTENHFRGKRFEAGFITTGPDNYLRGIDLSRLVHQLEKRIIEPVKA